VDNPVIKLFPYFDWQKTTLNVPSYKITLCPHIEMGMLQ
jgi:hypothetical protein